MRHLTKGGLVAALGLLSGTGLVQAADLPARSAPVPVFVAPVLSDWSGFYAGSTFGYDFTQFHTRQGAGSKSLSKSGQSGGGFVGYNYQFGHIVVGAEGGIDLNLVRGNAVTGVVPTHLDNLYDVRLRGRLGYEFGWFMPFVAGGAVINESYQSTVAPTQRLRGQPPVGRLHGRGRCRREGQSGQAARAQQHLHQRVPRPLDRARRISPRQPADVDLRVRWPELPDAFGQQPRARRADLALRRKPAPPLYRQQRAT